MSKRAGRKNVSALKKVIQDNNSSAQFWMTKKTYFLSADFQANPTDISLKKVFFLVIQNHALLFLDDL